MSLLDRINSTKFNIGTPNSNAVISEAEATIRTVQIVPGKKDDKERMLIFINLVSGDKRFVDVITYTEGNEENSHIYFAIHIKPLFQQLGIKADLESFNDIMAKLKDVMQEKKVFKIWTEKSENNPEYVDVQYAEV